MVKSMRLCVVVPPRGPRPMDDREKNKLGQETRLGLHLGPDEPEIPRQALEHTHLDPAESGLVAPDDPGPGDGSPAESHHDLPSWSSEVPDHSSWNPPDALVTPPPSGSGSAPAGTPPPKSRGSDRPSHAPGSGPKTPLGSNPTDDFDPEEVSAARLVEGKVLFKKYILRKQLGRGGMGEVWKVHHIELDCERALKFIRTGLSESPELRRRFRREARAMARVTHDNAVTIHDAFTAGGMAFIEMALVPGQSLVEILRPGRPMPLDWTVRILEQLCEVLSVAHQAGIVHRDLKPANLMLLNGRAAGRESLKVLDFGIAKLLSIEEHDGDSITNNAPIGTYPYMSPEQFGVAPVDTRSDLYTVGVILYEFLTGFRPYSAKSQLYPWLQQHVHAPIPRFRDRNPEVDLPAEVEEVVRRCLAKSADDRPQSAEELFRDFEAASGLVRSPVRGGSSQFVIKPADPPTRPGLGQSTERIPQGPGPFELPGHASPATLRQAESRLHPSRPGEPSSFSGDSYEWDAQGTATAASQAGRPRRPAGQPAGEGRGIGGKLLAAAAILLVGAGAAGTMLALSGKGKPPDPIATFDRRGQPTPTVIPMPYAKIPGGGQDVDGIHYDRFEHPTSHQAVYLPEGYTPSGTERAKDGWPLVIVRDEDKAEFVRIVGTDAYDAYKPAWKDPEPQDGRYVSGSNPREDIGKTLPIASFYLKKHEVTNREFAFFYRKSSGDPKRIKDLEGFYYDYLTEVEGNDDRDGGQPVASLGVEMARIYARSIGGDLPARAEWEYAASSQGTRTDFVWEPLKREEFKAVAVGRGPKSAGWSKKDVTEQGLCDMGGNVREWTADLRTDMDTMKLMPAACGGSFEDSDQLRLDECGIKAVHCVRPEGRNSVGLRPILRCPPAEVPAKRP